MLGARNQISKNLMPFDVTFEYMSASRDVKEMENVDLDALITDEIKGGVLDKGPNRRPGWLKAAVDKMKPFLRDPS